MLSKDNLPLVSIILSSYNHGKYIKACVESVLGQTFKDFELIIFDDGSKDDSQAILRNEAEKDSRIRLLLHEVNRGPRICTLEAMKQVRGRYVAMHHSDDLWEPEKLEKQVRYLEENPSCAACFTWVRSIDEEGCSYKAGEDYQAAIFDQENRSREEWLNHFFYQGNCLCHPSIVIRREMYEQCNLLDTVGVWQLPDARNWVRLCCQADIHIIPERLTCFRIRRQAQDNMSGDSVGMRVRDAYEHHLIWREYASIRNEKDFLSVFPEAEEFLHEGRLDVVFAFAMICLRSGKSFYYSDALDSLYRLLKDEEAAQRLKEWYGYTEQKFIADTGRYDSNGVSYTMPKMLVSLYWDDGFGYSERNKLTEAVYATPAGYFEAEYDIELPPSGKVKSLILNLHEGHFLNMAIDKCHLNGEQISMKPIESSGLKDGLDVFDNLHPRYEWFGLAENHLTMKIYGRIDVNEEMLLAEYVAKTNTRILSADEKIARQDDIIREYRAQQQTRGWKMLQKARRMHEWLCSLIGN